MIFDIILYILGSISAILVSVFSVISFAFPNQIENAIAFFFNNIWYLQGLIPVATLVICINILVKFILLFYGVKLVLHFLSGLPGISSNVNKLPTISSKVGKN